MSCSSDDAEPAFIARRSCVQIVDKDAIKGIRLTVAPAEDLSVGKCNAQAKRNGDRHGRDDEPPAPQQPTLADPRRVASALDVALE